MKVSRRNQKGRGRVSGEEKSYDREMRSGWVWEVEAGRVLPVSAPSVPVKFYSSCGEKAGGAAKKQKNLERVKRAFMECDTL